MLIAAQIAAEAKFCIRCSTALVVEERFGKLRPLCPLCGWVYFTDPKVAVAALIEQPGQVLLVRRAIDPLRGKWSLPAGFVDAGEDPVEALRRECLEETGLVVGILELLDVVFGQEHPRGAHIVIVYRAQALGGQLRAADDVDRAAYFDLGNLPELAFSTTRRVLDGLRKPKLIN